MTSPRLNKADKVRILTYKISLDDIPKHNLDYPGVQPMTTNYIFSPDPPPPPSKDGISYPGTKRLPESTDRRSSSSGHLTPLSKSALLDRRPQARSPSPSPNVIDTSNLSSPRLTNGDNSPAETHHAWSTAVGRATTGGKSGRVIERLMNENDRILREKRLATVRLEEEIKRGESARSAIESLQLSNANLTSLHESDLALLDKRDRRIQQLRDDLETEKRRRLVAEEEIKETQRERDSTIDRLRRQTTEDNERCARATSQYDSLSSSWASLQAQYAKRTKKLTSDVSALRSALEHDQRRLAQMEVVMEQLSQEADKTNRAKSKLFAEFEQYKSDHEIAVRDIKEKARQNDRLNDQAQQQLMELLGQMRYVVNVKKHLREAA